jgi:hypothetical protein
MPNGLILQSGSWIISSSTPQLPTGYLVGLYGPGYDGDLTVSGTYTLSRETYFNNLTLTGTGTVKPAGHKLFVKGTLTINSGCSINDDGNSTTTNTIGATLLSRGTLGAQSGPAGAGNTVAGNGANGGASVSMVPPYNIFGAIPSGGVGGNAGIRTGGTTTANAPTFGQGLASTWWSARLMASALTTGNNNGWAGGGGGGGGANSSGAGSYGGGGGGGGGVVYVAAYSIVNNGRISANGGNGGNASGSGDAGGGGGGAGGSVILITNTPSSSVGLLQVSGGSGGNSIGTGSVGTTGSSGSYFVLSFGGN